ncbi:Apc13p protein-domain-containing protein [Aspergillus avenaceus]|uniref:Apc13p protein-domain-containing protein n=1 Tax=Aspergillus avenaceus TaxID=36643 RepID=A0A5N6TDJ4_ASPAV|nr:Apc13p protein-domain-containing protein [Aspergillus avenaceus]
MHHPRLADQIADFTRPHTTLTTTAQAQNQGPYGSSSPTLAPSYLPIEDIYVLPQFQPPNPEDEDDVVPDQHAAFGISRAMEKRREAVWRDLGLEGLVAGRKGGGGGKNGGGGFGGRRGCLR